MKKIIVSSLKEYMNGVREKIDVCENDKGLIDLEINLHTMILDKK